ncbi:hypothetical protein HK101_008894 [Irineochytrium annulatum]|nr:hypothetical protein HK101_008894 [Irineochytrium annulatum]
MLTANNADSTHLAQPQPQILQRSSSLRMLTPPPDKPRGWRVYLGLVPLRNPGWLTYLPASTTIPHHPSCTSFVVIFWEQQLTSYEIVEGQHGKPFERAGKTMQVDRSLTTEQRVKLWLAANTTHEILEVGTTTRSVDDAANYHRNWRRNALKYHSFWDNNAAFVDQFVTSFVNEVVLWKVSFVAPVMQHRRTRSAGNVDVNGSKDWPPKPSENTAPHAPNTSAMFESPLAYALWRKQHSADSYLSLLGSKHLKSEPGAGPNSRDLLGRYSMTLRPNGRVDFEIEARDNTLEDEPNGDHLHPHRHNSRSRGQTHSPSPARSSSPPFTADGLGYGDVPALTIVIMIVGSRGDVQPFVALGKELQKYGHRVRLATHANFRGFVTENGLEFYPLAGDPNELMAYMVKNPGLLPGLASIQAGDIAKKRKMIEEILESCYKACVDPDPEDPLKRSFLCQSIISNPPAFGHIHCAQRLFVPVHIFFTMPWSPTRAFPHPLVNVNYTASPKPMTNLYSYDLVEFMTWEGLGDIVNNFRMGTLGLPRIPAMVAPVMLKLLKVPHTYTWSEALIKKPADWGDHIDISGFFFLDLASNYEPPTDLKAFLESGSPPVYIGFGSIVVDDPDALTQLIFQAVEKAGVRALVSKGWGGLGGENLKVPDNVYMIGNCPHDWLFQRVSCVVHHGGAGTTAAGLKAGKPTTIVPFFGDQPFWGAMIASITAGPPPIPFKRLTADRLAEAILFALLPETGEAARAASIRIASEDGVAEGARSFHRHLPLTDMRCDVNPTRVAAWYLPTLNIKLSAHVANILTSGGRITSGQLLSYRYMQWEPENAKASAAIAEAERVQRRSPSPSRGRSPARSSPRDRSPSGVGDSSEPALSGGQVLAASLSTGVSASLDSIAKSTQVGGDVQGRGVAGRLASGVMTGIHQSLYVTKAGYGGLAALLGGKAGRGARDWDGKEIIVAPAMEGEVVGDSGGRVGVRQAEAGWWEGGAPRGRMVRAQSREDTIAAIQDAQDILERYDVLLATITSEASAQK